MGMVRMSKKDGMKTMQMIEQQVESAKTMKTRWNQWQVNMTQDSTALHPRHKRETGVIASLSFKGLQHQEDPKNNGMQQAVAVDQSQVLVVRFLMDGWMIGGLL